MTTQQQAIALSNDKLTQIDPNIQLEQRREFERSKQEQLAYERDLAKQEEQQKYAYEKQLIKDNPTLLQERDASGRLIRLYSSPKEYYSYKREKDDYKIPAEYIEKEIFITPEKGYKEIIRGIQKETKGSIEERSIYNRITRQTDFITGQQTQEFDTKTARIREPVKQQSTLQRDLFNAQVSDENKAIRERMIKEGYYDAQIKKAQAQGLKISDIESPIAKRIVKLEQYKQTSTDTSQRVERELARQQQALQVGQEVQQTYLNKLGADKLQLQATNKGQSVRYFEQPDTGKLTYRVSETGIPETPKGFISISLERFSLISSAVKSKIPISLVPTTAYLKLSERMQSTNTKLDDVFTGYAKQQPLLILPKEEIKGDVGIGLNLGREPFILLDNQQISKPEQSNIIQKSILTIGTLKQTFDIVTGKEIPKPFIPVFEQISKGIQLFKYSAFDLQNQAVVQFAKKTQIFNYLSTGLFTTKEFLKSKLNNNLSPNLSSNPLSLGSQYENLIKFPEKVTSILYGISEQYRIQPETIYPSLVIGTLGGTIFNTASSGITAISGTSLIGKSIAKGSLIGLKTSIGIAYTASITSRTLQSPYSDTYIKFGYAFAEDIPFIAGFALSKDTGIKFEPRTIQPNKIKTLYVVNGQVIGEAITPIRDPLIISKSGTTINYPISQKINYESQNYEDILIKILTLNTRQMGKQGVLRNINKRRITKAELRERKIPRQQNYNLLQGGKYKVYRSDLRNTETLGKKVTTFRVIEAPKTIETYTSGEIPSVKTESGKPLFSKPIYTVTKRSDIPSKIIGKTELSRGKKAYDVELYGTLIDRKTIPAKEIFRMIKQEVAPIVPYSTIIPDKPLKIIPYQKRKVALISSQGKNLQFGNLPRNFDNIIQDYNSITTQQQQKQTLQQFQKTKVKPFEYVFFPKAPLKQQPVFAGDVVFNKPYFPPTLKDMPSSSDVIINNFEYETYEQPPTKVFGGFRKGMRDRLFSRLYDQRNQLYSARGNFILVPDAKTNNNYQLIIKPSNSKVTLIKDTFKSVSEISQSDRDLINHFESDTGILYNTDTTRLGGEYLPPETELGTIPISQVRSGILSGFKFDNLFKYKSNYDLFNDTEPATKIKKDTDLGIKQATITETNEVSIEIFKPDQTSIQKPKTTTSQDTKLRSTYINIQFPKTPKPLIPNKPIKYILEKPEPKQPDIVKPFLRLPKRKVEQEQPSKQGYDVYVKDKGVFIKANTKPLPHNKALNLGAEVTDNTASATFETRPSKRPAKGFDDFMFNDNVKFRKGKKENQWIEKNTYRIDTAGEIKGISAKGWIANRRKNQWGSLL